MVMSMSLKVKPHCWMTECKARYSSPCSQKHICKYEARYSLRGEIFFALYSKTYLWGARRNIYVHLSSEANLSVSQSARAAVSQPAPPSTVLNLKYRIWTHSPKFRLFTSSMLSLTTSTILSTLSYRYRILVFAAPGDQKSVSYYLATHRIVTL